MLPERFRTIFRGSGATALPVAPGSLQRRSALYGGKEIITTRPSRGLEQFFSYIRDRVGLSILDLGGATQENINFITNLGHRIYTQNFLHSLDQTFGNGDGSEQSNAGRIDYFLSQNLDYQADTFDAVLLWDVLQYMSPPLLSATLRRLRQIVKPKSYLLAFFNSNDRAAEIPSYSFRIQDATTLVVAQHGSRTPVQAFNNRSLEKLFGEFESVKFFLTREHLREVIIKH